MYQNLSWAQLEAGTLATRQRVVAASPVDVALREFNLGFKAEATVAPRRTIVGLLADTRTRARWFGARVDQGTIVASQGCIDVRTTGPSRFYEIGIDTALLAHQYPTAPDAIALIEHAKGARIAQAHVQTERLRAFIGLLFAMKAPQRSVTGSLVPLLAATIETFEKRSVEPSKSLIRRLYAVRSCEAYMRQHADTAVTLLDLSVIAGMRSRSLINAFEAVTGFSPMDYLKRLRLNGVYRALRQADKARTKIIDVASAWGFWHMGHFAADYRAMFGEAPSRTLLK